LPASLSVPAPAACAAYGPAKESLVESGPDLKAADPAAGVSDLEAAIDRRVKFPYFQPGEAPSYDDWVQTRDTELKEAST
jgi:hypothetical protein